MKKKRLLTAVMAFAIILQTAIFAQAASYKGDVDNDGAVNSTDALIVLKYAVGLTDSINAERADMDGDKAVNSTDALKILQTTVGMIELEVIPEKEPDPPAEPEKTPEEKYVESFTSRVNNELIRKNMVGISDNIGSRWYTYNNLTSAYNFIVSALKGYGFQSNQIVSDSFSANGTSVKNIYCTIPTSVKNADVIVFCAHYDSAQSGKGAVDNASGVCAVLETARVMKSMNKDFGKEIRFCFFAGEEIGYYGSSRYCWYISQSTSSSPASIGRHKFVLNIDMAAHHKQSKNWYLCVSTEPVTPSYSYRKAQKNYTSNSIDAAKALIGSCGEYKYLSPVSAGQTDLVSFRLNGVAGANLSWREIDSSRSAGSEQGLASPSLIHTSSDTVSNTDMDSLYKTVRLIAGAAAEATFKK